jgi:proteasome lid subunit RPN8/RPN11
MQPFRTKSKAVPPTPLVRQGPADNRDFVAFVSTRDGFRAYVRSEVLEHIKGEAERAAPNETIGLLAGRFCYDPSTGPYTLVLDADGAHGAEVEASPGYVRITAAGQATVRTRLERANPDREIVGWYHSHPRYEARFSNVDESEQATWTDAGHLGIVYSGIDRAEPFGVYRGPHADRLSRQGYQTQRPTVFIPPPEARPADRPLSPEGAHAPAPAPQARGAREARSALLPWALTLALACLTAGIFWLGLRVLTIEGKLNEYAMGRQSAPVPASTPKVEPPPAEPPASVNAAAAGRTNAQLADPPSLHPPAKTLSPERTADRGQPPREQAKAEAKAKAERAAQAKKRAAASRGKQASQPMGTKKADDGSQGQQPAPKGQGEESKSNNKPPKQF